MSKVDPTVEYVPIEIEGQTYRMAFDLGSLAKAESEVNLAGGSINVLHGVNFKEQNMNAILILFACSLQRAHPELKYEDVLALTATLEMKTLGRIYEAVIRTWMKSMGVETADLEKKVETVTETTGENPASNAGSESGASLATA